MTRSGLAVLVVLALSGSACGRYGPPRRPASPASPAPPAVAEPSAPEDSTAPEQGGDAPELEP